MGLTNKILRNEKPLQAYAAYFRGRVAGYGVGAPPIFIVGCGHSGTSVLLRLLGAHSKIHGVPYESRLFMHSEFKMWLAETIWNRDTVANRKHRWVEKTPAHVRKIENIFARYPNARVLFMVRDGRDVSVSLRKRIGEFEKGLRRWLDDNRSGLSWIEDPRVMLLKYEDLVQRYQETMPAICEFIGEKFEDEMLKYHSKPAYIFSKNTENPESGFGDNHKHHRNWQINQELFDGSGKWKQEMTEEEKTIFKEQAIDMLIELGYAKDSNW